MLYYKKANLFSHRVPPKCTHPSGRTLFRNSSAGCDAMINGADRVADMARFMFSAHMFRFDASDL